MRKCWKSYSLWPSCGSTNNLRVQTRRATRRHLPLPLAPASPCKCPAPAAFWRAGSPARGAPTAWWWTRRRRPRPRQDRAGRRRSPSAPATTRGWRGKEKWQDGSYTSAGRRCDSATLRLSWERRSSSFNGHHWRFRMWTAWNYNHRTSTCESSQGHYSEPPLIQNDPLWGHNVREIHFLTSNQIHWWIGLNKTQQSRIHNIPLGAIELEKVSLLLCDGTKWSRVVVIFTVLMVPLPLARLLFNYEANKASLIRRA